MPVHDSELHDKTRVTGDTPYGCANKPNSEFYYALNRDYDRDGKFRIGLMKIPNTFSTKCRYDKRASDARCGSCTRESDVEYLRSYGL